MMAMLAQMLFERMFGGGRGGFPGGFPGGGIRFSMGPQGPEISFDPGPGGPGGMGGMGGMGGRGSIGMGGMGGMGGPMGMMRPDEGRKEDYDYDQLSKAERDQWEEDNFTKSERMAKKHKQQVRLMLMPV
jgi:hypothetical protein